MAGTVIDQCADARRKAAEALSGPLGTALRELFTSFHRGRKVRLPAYAGAASDEVIDAVCAVQLPENDLLSAMYGRIYWGETDGRGEYTLVLHIPQTDSGIPTDLLTWTDILCGLQTELPEVCITEIPENRLIIVRRITEAVP